MSRPNVSAWKIQGNYIYMQIQIDTYNITNVTFLLIVIYINTNKSFSVIKWFNIVLIMYPSHVGWRYIRMPGVYNVTLICRLALHENT